MFLINYIPLLLLFYNNIGAESSVQAREIIDELFVNHSDKAMDIITLLVKELCVASFFSPVEKFEQEPSYSTTLNSPQKSPQSASNMSTDSGSRGGSGLKPTLNSTSKIRIPTIKLSRLGTVPLPSAEDVGIKSLDELDDDDDSGSDIPSQSSDSSINDDDTTNEEKHKEYISVDGVWRSDLADKIGFDSQSSSLRCIKPSSTTSQSTIRTNADIFTNTDASTLGSIGEAVNYGVDDNGTDFPASGVNDEISLRNKEQIYKAVHLAIQSVSMGNGNDSVETIYCTQSLLEFMTTCIVTSLEFEDEDAEDAENAILDVFGMFFDEPADEYCINLICKVVGIVLTKIGLINSNSVSSGDSDGDSSSRGSSSVEFQNEVLIENSQLSDSDESSSAESNSDDDDDDDDSEVVSESSSNRDENAAWNLPKSPMDKEFRQSRGGLGKIPMTFVETEGDFDNETGSIPAWLEPKSPLDEVFRKRIGGLGKSEILGGIPQFSDDDDDVTPSHDNDDDSIDNDNKPAWLQPKSPLDNAFRQSVGGIGKPEMDKIVKNLAVFNDSESDLDAHDLNVNNDDDNDTFSDRLDDEEEDDDEFDNLNSSGRLLVFGLDDYEGNSEDNPTRPQTRGGARKRNDNFDAQLEASEIDNDKYQFSINDDDLLPSAHPSFSLPIANNGEPVLMLPLKNADLSYDALAAYQVISNQYSPKNSKNNSKNKKIVTHNLAKLKPSSTSTSILTNSTSSSPKIGKYNSEDAEEFTDLYRIYDMTGKDRGSFNTDDEDKQWIQSEMIRRNPYLLDNVYQPQQRASYDNHKVLIKKNAGLRKSTSDIINKKSNANRRNQERKKLSLSPSSKKSQSNSQVTNKKSEKKTTNIKQIKQRPVSAPATRLSSHTATVQHTNLRNSKSAVKITNHIQKNKKQVINSSAANTGKDSNLLKLNSKTLLTPTTNSLNRSNELYNSSSSPVKRQLGKNRINI
jgi:hypothetical protein